MVQLALVHALIATTRKVQSVRCVKLCHTFNEFVLHFNPSEMVTPFLVATSGPTLAEAKRRASCS